MQVIQYSDYIKKDTFKCHIINPIIAITIQFRIILKI